MKEVRASEYLNKQPETAEADPIWAELAQQSLQAAPEARVLPLTHAGRRAWVKRASAAEANIWHGILRFGFWLTRNPFFLPTVAIDAEAVAQGELRRIRVLEKHGVSVPRVLAEGEGWFVLSDGGKPLSTILRDASLPLEERRTLVTNVAEALAGVHRKGRWHGRPVLKDMVWNGEGLLFLDFEEDVGRFLNPQQCIVRDAIVFVHGLFRVLRKGDELELAEAGFVAFWNASDPAVRTAVLYEVKKMRLLYWAGRCLRPILGGDGVAILKMLDRILAER